MAGNSSIAPLVLFDLDGTLVDSAPDLEQAMNRYLAELDLPAVNSSAFRRRVSQGGRAMLRLTFAGEDDDALGLRLPRFLSIYADSIAECSGLFDVMREVLDAINAAGSRWGVVSNKPFVLAEKLVSVLGLDDECALLFGGDSLPTRKPDPEPLRVACEHLGVEVCDAVYVGDDRRDIDAARAAPMPSLKRYWAGATMDRSKGALSGSTVRPRTRCGSRWTRCGWRGCRQLCRTRSTAATWPCCW